MSHEPSSLSVEEPVQEREAPQSDDSSVVTEMPTVVERAPQQAEIQQEG